MPQQRSKGRHLAALEAAVEAMEHAHRRAMIAVAQARQAGASLAEVAAHKPPIATPVKRCESRQHVHQHYAGVVYDAEADVLIWPTHRFPWQQ